MLDVKSPRDQALALIAAYDKPDSDAYERHVVRLTRAWLRLIANRRPSPGLVATILDELNTSPADGYGCGWDLLRQGFTAWAAGIRKPEGDKPKSVAAYEDL